MKSQVWKAGTLRRVKRWKYLFWGRVASWNFPSNHWRFLELSDQAKKKEGKKIFRSKYIFQNKRCSELEFLRQSIPHLRNRKINTSSFSCLSMEIVSRLLAEHQLAGGQQFGYIFWLRPWMALKVMIKISKSILKQMGVPHRVIKIRVMWSLFLFLVRCYARRWHISAVYQDRCAKQNPHFGFLMIYQIIYVKLTLPWL